MRTTLTIDDDVLSAAKERAELERKTVGEVISALARQAMRPTASSPVPEAAFLYSRCVRMRNRSHWSCESIRDELP